MSKNIYEQESFYELNHILKKHDKLLGYGVVSIQIKTYPVDALNQQPRRGKKKSLSS